MLPGYQLLHRLSRSSSVTDVWSARRVEDGALVALKGLTDAGRGREDLAHRFHAEGELLVRLGGRHGLIGCSLAVDEPPVLVLELAEGGSVRDLIRSGGGASAPLAVPTVLRLAQQMVTALAWLHHNGVVHRDVKPGNILLMADGTWRLADLGVAAQGTPCRGLPAGWIEEEVGTLGYAAPELLRDASAATPTLDVYGLGVALYEMLSGRLPFDLGPDENDSALRNRIAGGESPVPLEERGRAPGGLARAVMQAIAPEPGERFSTMAEFAARLNAR